MKSGLIRNGLVLCILLLFVGAGAIPSMGGTVVEKTTSIDSKSGIYIQDLIDNASSGDTIYIPNGTYYETIIINKSICLIGADKDTTFIDGSGSGDIIHISADEVKVSGFTIQNSGDEWNDAGIDIYSSYNTITDNIITNNKYGIYLEGSSNNIISGNTILHNIVGIFVGVFHISGPFNIIRDSSGNRIFENNFLLNLKHALFNYFEFNILSLNHWYQNYWNRPRILPKLIFGLRFTVIPWFNVDWRPALRPYDDFTEAENASVVAKVENSKIKITLTTGGQNYPSNGYSFAHSVTIRLNGTALDENNLEGNTGWEVGESLFIGGITPILDDEESAIGPLAPGSYSITVTIIETVVFDDSITIV